MTGRRGLLQWQRTCPDAVERIALGGGQVAVGGRAQVQDGQALVGDAVGVLADQELVVGAVDGVVQDALVQPDLHARALAY